MGADYTYLVTSGEKLGVISQASPDLITMLHTNQEDLEKLPFTSLLVGCGIDRSDESAKFFADAVGAAKNQNVPLVVDADGLFFLSLLLQRTNLKLGALA